MKQHRLSIVYPLVAAAFLCLPSSARPDDMAYVTTGTQAFGVVDLNTGVFTQRGVSSAYLYGFGEVNDVLYGASDVIHGAGSTNTLYSINLSNGALTAVATTSIEIYELGSTRTSLYALGPNFTDLYSINAQTGAATLIGPTGLGIGTTSGLSVGADALYVEISTAGGSTLYSLSTTTGSATKLGTSPSGCIKSTAYEDFTLFGASGYCSSASQIFAVNQADGSSQLLANVTGFTDLNGLAPTVFPTASATPEPGSGVLLLSGLAGLAFCVRRIASKSDRVSVHHRP